MEANRNTLLPKDVEAIREQVRELEGTSAVTQSRQQVVGRQGNWNTTIYGVDPAYFTIRNWTLASGRIFTESEVRGRAKIAVVGQTIVDELFAGANPVGQQVRIGTVPFQIIGTLEEKGSGFGGNQDDVVITPWTTVLYRLNGERFLQSINVSAAGDDVMAIAEARIRSVLRIQHGLLPGQPDDFEIQNQADLMETVSSVTQTLTLFLGAIAGISLFVGGIGIMNIMLVSVTERTREIGIRLAVGARGSDVLEQFLVEAVLLSIAGGILGLAVGIGLAALITNLLDMPLLISPSVPLIATGFSGAVGIFFGYYPARKAAALDPIQALRYE
jgi:putative ABC transport system permease protein